MLAKEETKSNKIHTNGHAKRQKSGDEIWDELLASPESKKLLLQMAEEAKKEFREGKCEPGGFGF